MPSLYTHQMIAKKVFEKLRRPKYIENNFDEFLLGCIGLEMFNYHKLLKMMQSSQLEQMSSTLKYAKHKEFLTTLIEDSKGDVKHMVYVLGLMTNYAADRTIRPYVHSRTEKPEGGGDVVKQAEFEQALDAYLYRETELETTVAQGEFIQKIKRKDIKHVSKLIRNGCKNIFPNARIWTKDITASFLDTEAFTKRIQIDKSDAMSKMKIYEAMIGKTGMLSIYVPPNIIGGNDMFNFAHRTWRAPFAISAARNESVTDLIGKSVELSVDIINKVNGYYIDECSIEEVENAYGDINFNGREM